MVNEVMTPDRSELSIPLYVPTCIQSIVCSVFITKGYVELIEDTN